MKGLHVWLPMVLVAGSCGPAQHETERAADLVDSTDCNHAGCSGLALSSADLPECVFVCDDGEPASSPKSAEEPIAPTSLAEAIEGCEKGALVTTYEEGQERRCRAPSGPPSDEGLDRSHLDIELIGIVTRNISLPAVKLRSLTIHDSRVEGTLNLERATVGELTIERGVLGEVVLRELEAARDVMILNSTVHGKVDAAGLRTARMLALEGSVFEWSDRKTIGADFGNVRAERLNAARSKFKGGAQFTSLRVEHGASFAEAEFHGFLDAGAITANDSVISFHGARFLGSEETTNPSTRPPTRCRDAGHGTSIEIYRATAALFDLRGIVARARVLNLNESVLTRFDVADANLCGLLLSAAKVEVLNVDGPDKAKFTSIANTDARGLTVERFVSRAELDPVTATARAFGRIEDKASVFMTLAAQLQSSGQIEWSAHAYRVAHDVPLAWDTHLPAQLLYVVTGDGRYPLVWYFAAFGVVLVVAVASFRRKPERWSDERKNLSYSSFWFALDVVTPGFLDLGYRGVEVFGPQQRRQVRLHNILHVLGVMVIAVIVVAVTMRVP